MTQTKATFTKGPWETVVQNTATEWRTRVYTLDCLTRLADVYADDWSTSYANARLIAQSPTMYELLARCRDSLDPNLNWHDELQDDIDAVRKAVEG